MFLGQWPRMFDKKNRMTIPSQFVGEFNGEVLIFFEPSKKEVLAYSTEGVEKLAPEKMKYFVIAKIDDQGRIVIPKNICTASFSGCNEVVWEGWGDHFKILSKK